MHLRARYDWNKLGRPRIALATRIGGALITGMAALSWPLFLIMALRDWTIVFAPLLITAGAVVQRAAMRKVYGVPAEPEPGSEPDPRVPRDTDRPYPRPKGGRRKPDRTCPVCGTGAETTALDGRVLGWRAHGSCAEWLGDWRPQRPVPPPYSPNKSLIGYMEKGQRPAGSTNTVHYAGGTAVTIGAGGGGGTSEVVMDWLANGLISTDEARLRLNVEMLSGFGLPGPDLGERATFTRKACPDCGMEFSGVPADISRSFTVHANSGQCEQRRRKQAPAAIDEYCTCGMKFCGTPARIRVMLDEHRASGACPHSVKGRAADHPKPNFAPNRPTGPTAPDTRP